MCNPKAQPWEVVTEGTALDYRILNSLTLAPTRPLTSHYCPACNEDNGDLARSTISDHSIFFPFGSPSVRRLVLRPASSQLSRSGQRHRGGCRNHPWAMNVVCYSFNLLAGNVHQLSAPVGE
jgi:hypothetical protein